MNANQSVRVVYYPSSGRQYNAEELGEIFSKYAVGDALEVALRQILQQRFASAAIDVANTKATDREASHAAGRIQEILDLQTELYSYFGVAIDAAGEMKPKPKTRRARAT